MPVYEYRCEKCGEFEHTQRITDPALRRCPTCKRKVRRRISSTSFQLKGSGWYVTDYARAGNGKDKAKKDGTGDTPAPAAGGETGSTSETAKTETPKAESAKKPAGGKPARASA
jgi:putative FmdB family regulatory protein